MGKSDANQIRWSIKQFRKAAFFTGFYRPGWAFGQVLFGHHDRLGGGFGINKPNLLAQVDSPQLDGLVQYPAGKDCAIKPSHLYRHQLRPPIRHRRPTVMSNHLQFVRTVCRKLGRKLRMIFPGGHFAFARSCACHAPLGIIPKA